MPDGLLIGWWKEGYYDWGPITYKGDLHQLIIGGTGGGKFTTAIAPMLLGSGLEDQTVVAIDPKGEIAKLAGPYFQVPFADRPNVFLLDPWDECGTGTTSCLTFMEFLTPGNPNVVDDARALAEAMVIPSGNENTHWDHAARNFLAAILMHVALHPKEEGRRDLLRVREIVTLPWTVKDAEKFPDRELLQRLLLRYLDPPHAELANGAIRRGFTAMLNREEKERSGIVSTLDRETAWLDSAAMQKVLRGPSLDLKQAALGGGKYFVVLPTTYLSTQKAWLRLCIAAFSKAFKTYPLPKDGRPAHKRWRHIVIDEFPTLGEMGSVLDDIAIGRGYGIKYHLVVQDLPQLERIYHKGWQTFVGSSFQRVFAVNDVNTTGYVSTMLGETTVIARGTTSTRSEGTSTSRGMSHGINTGSSTPPGFFRMSGSSSGTSEGWSHSTSENRSYSYGESTSEVQRRLMTLEEVRRLSSDDQLILMGNRYPVHSWRPSFLDIFPSQPDYSLSAILNTIGRQPADEAERLRFTAWRDGPRVMRPPERAKPIPPSPELNLPVVWVPPRPRNWRLIMGLVCLALAGLLLVFGYD